MATTYYEDIQKLYVAYFNRPADTAGLAYWESVVEGLHGDTSPVWAAFSAETEYKDAYAGMSNAQIVDQVYQNLFGRAAEDAGKAYWADLLDSGAITIDKVVTEIAAGAQGSDSTAYTNKVAAAAAFTAALDTPAEQAGYTGAAANLLAKAFMSGITDDVSLDDALSGGHLDTAIAQVVAAGTPFSVSTGLAALDAANAAHAAFLDAADGHADGSITLGDADIAAGVDAATAAVGALTAGDYVHASVAVRAALLADAQAFVQKEATDASSAITAAEASIARISGLGAAIEAQAGAEAAVVAANAALASAVTALNTAATAYEVLHSTTLSIAADGTVTGLIALDPNGQLALASGVTEDSDPGVTALLGAIVGQQAASAAADAAVHADAAAVEAVNYLDMGATEKADLQAVAAAMTDVLLPANALPTLAQMKAEQSILDSRADAAAQAVVDAGANATQADIDAANAAAASAASFKSLVDTYHADYTANARIDALVSAKAALDGAHADAAALDGALAALNQAVAMASQLKGVNAAVDAAGQAFLDHGMSMPVTAQGALFANTGSDVYVAGAADASIAQFGVQGSDALYIGGKYTLSTDMAHGDDAVLEAFVLQDGANTVIKLENKTFASSEASPEVVTITLTGVDATHVHLANGVITVS